VTWSVPREYLGDELGRELRFHLVPETMKGIRADGIRKCMVSIVDVVWNSENGDERIANVMLLDQLKLCHVHQA